MARESVASRAAMNTSASRGRDRPIRDPISPTFVDLFFFPGSSLADVLALRPSRIAIRPETPPIEATVVGALSKAIGPKITSALATPQPMIAMKTQAPSRAHHSRSSSSTLARLLETPTKNVAASRNVSQENGNGETGVELCRPGHPGPLRSF